MHGEIDDVSLQRLVDGEMSDEERRRYLTSLDACPQLWRSVALAFVEGQLLSDVLRREMAADVMQPANVQTPQSVRTRRRSWG